MSIYHKAVTSVWSFIVKWSELCHYESQLVQDNIWQEFEYAKCEVLMDKQEFNCVTMESRGEVCFMDKQG